MKDSRGKSKSQKKGKAGSYSLRRNEEVTTGFRRIALGQVNWAVQELQGAGNSRRDAAVHEARKSLKKLRAVLRLIRGATRKKLYKKENRYFRDVSRQLAQLRQNRVMLETFDKLRKESPSLFRNSTAKAARKVLVRRYEETLKKAQSSLTFPEVVRALQAARERVEQWEIEGSDLTCCRPGLRRVRAQEEKRFKQARKSPTAERLHEWRKSVKYLGYNLRTLQPVWRPDGGELMKELDRLAEYLGLEHDLVEFRRTFLSFEESPEGKQRIRKIIQTIDKKREEHWKVTLDLAEKVHLGDTLRSLPA